MNMSGLQSLVMGLVSGFAEMLPISADAHRLILRTIFGISTEDAFFRLVCHVASLLMVLWLCQSEIRHLRRTNRIMKTPARRRRQKLDLASSYTIRLLKTSIVAMLIVRVVLSKLTFIQNRPAYMTIAMFINGVFLLVPSLIRNGNMDSRNMPKITGVVMGIGGGLAGIPGISHMGTVTSFAVSSGVDRRYALRFAMLLLIPNLTVDALFDLSAVMVSGGVPTGSGLVFSLLGGLLAAIATYFGCRLMHWIANRRGFDCFAYYCWGAALVCYILFLIV